MAHHAPVVAALLLPHQTMAHGTKLAPAVHVAHDTPWERRDLLGVHPQKQEGLSWVGASVPSGRITADDLDVSAAALDSLGWGAARVTGRERLHAGGGCSAVFCRAPQHIPLISAVRSQ